MKFLDAGQRFDADQRGFARIRILAKAAEPAWRSPQRVAEIVLTDEVAIPSRKKTNSSALIRTNPRPKKLR
jgi:hypothetical protein